MVGNSESDSYKSDCEVILKVLSPNQVKECLPSDHHTYDIQTDVRYFPKKLPGDALLNDDCK